MTSIHGRNLPLKTNTQQRPLDIAPRFMQASPSCQAIFFYYTCGCRTLEPIFCCQPHTDTDLSAPSQVHVGLWDTDSKTEACTAEDPGARKFVREADTALPLELAKLGGILRDDIDASLPKKMESSFTAAQVALKDSIVNGKRRFSPNAAPFVPRSGVFATTLAPVPAPEQVVDADTTPTDTDTIQRDENQEDEKYGHEQEEGITEVTLHTLLECEDGENVETIEEITEMTSNEFVEVKLHSRTAEERIAVTRQTPPGRQYGEGAGKFIEIELRSPTPEHMVYDKLAAGTLDELEPGRSATDLDRSNDDMTTLRAFGDAAERQAQETSYWSVFSLFGRFSCLP
ncbi:hypothetical protein NUW58_g8975 [Xylaria curta]|uniref:Uncharacterized protein n=1 Tax=Xylaria curta TaxID=42375 RepID=A0ACC1N1Z0_9PEZI|nr:hypothetical protein NUW58_g8975 [Xylaria curta]